MSREDPAEAHGVDVRLWVPSSSAMTVTDERRPPMTIRRYLHQRYSYARCLLYQFIAADICAFWKPAASLPLTGSFVLLSSISSTCLTHNDPFIFPPPRASTNTMTSNPGVTIKETAGLCSKRQKTLKFPFHSHKVSQNFPGPSHTHVLSSCANTLCSFKPQNIPPLNHR